MLIPVPLRSPQFRSVWVAGLLSDAGDWMLLVALPLVVYNLTGSAFGTSIALLVELLPGIVLAPVAGRCVDRWDRRRLLVWVSAAQGLCLTPLLLVHSRSDLPIVYAVILVEAALLALFDPAKNAWLPTLVPDADLVAANALSGVGVNVSRLIGGPLGGVILAVGGLRLVTVVDGVSFLLAASLIGSVAAAGDAKAARPADGDETGSLRSAIGARPIRSALVVTFIAQVAQGIFVVLFILFVVQRLHGGDSQVGLYRGVQAIGAVAGALVLTALSRRWTATALIAPSLVVFGLLDFGLWNLSFLTTATWLYIVMFIVVGAPGLLLVTGIVSSLQESTADHHRGRVFSVLGLVGNAGQLVGIVTAGLLTARVGLMVLLNAQAAIYLVAAVPSLKLAAVGRAARRASGRTPPGSPPERSALGRVRRRRTTVATPPGR